MDDRVREHAEILVDWSTDVQRGDNVVISASEGADDLVVALNEEIAKRGAEPITVYSPSEASRAFLTNYDGEFSLPDHKLALYEEADVVISIRSGANLRAMKNVPGDLLAERARAMEPVREERLSKRWCLTQHPTNAHAQMAEMSLSEYEDFVYSAVLRDWEEVEEEQEILKERLDDASEVYIEGEDTEIRMSVDGMNAVNSCGRHNMPSGEVFTAPVVDSVEGEVLFDKPLIHQGRKMEGVSLRFEEGDVVEFSAERNEEILEDILTTDEGASRLGELGIGTNREIDVFSNNMLFDEKMGDTIHMALGRAYDDNVGEGREQNQSAVHVDMIKDVSDGRIEFDGEVIQENGRFVWEDE
ncbi:MAG: aminopeptidase [Halobacteria archaeon]|nr:aminopeptidase [Halobacteria archaeon]